MQNLGYYLESRENPLLPTGVFSRIYKCDNETRLATGPSTPLSNVPLDVFLSIDERISSKIFGKCRGSVAFYYTFASTVCYESFQYRLQGHEVEWIKHAKCDMRTDDITCCLPDCYIEHYYDLRPASCETMRISEKLNQGLQLSELEEFEYGSDTRQFADKSVGGYPLVDVVNQLSGVAFLQQRTKFPFCYVCEGKMDFALSMTRCERIGIEFIPPGVQVVFFVCTKCNTIDARHVA